MRNNKWTECCDNPTNGTLNLFLIHRALLWWQKISRRYSKCYGTRDGPYSLTYRMTIIAALNNPARAIAAGNDTDMVFPYHNSPNLWAASIMADRYPVSSKPEMTIGHP